MGKKFSFHDASINFRTHMFISVLILPIVLRVSQGQTYNSELEIYDSVLGNSSAYNTRVRPLLDQSKVGNKHNSYSHYNTFITKNGNSSIVELWTAP